MSYEMISKELKIEACNIEDLTLEQVKGFLNLWNNNSSISTLTLFLKKDGTVVLNKDNKKYEFYKDLCCKFLGSNNKEREMLKREVKECAMETIGTLENALELRHTEEIFEILKYNFAKVDDISYDLLKKIYKYNERGAMGLFKVFTLGYIEGKRAERARKLKHGVEK